MSSIESGTLRVVIAAREHPHAGKSGVVIESDVALSLSFLGKADRIRLDDGQECFAKRHEWRSTDEL